MGLLILVMGAGVIALIWVMHDNAVKKAAAAATWPTTPGTVRTSGVDTNTTRTKSGRRTTYQARVTYDYAVGGASYTGNDISTGMEMGYSYENQARAISDRYPVGGAVTVYHNPQKPTETVLEFKKPGKTVTVVLTVILTFLTLILAAVFGMMT